MTPLIQTLLFFCALSLFIGVGFILLRFFFASHRSSFFIETLLFSFALGIAFIDFSLLLLGTLGTPLNSRLITLCLGSVLVIGGLMWYRQSHRSHILDEAHSQPLLRSKPERLLFFVLFIFTIFLKTLYLSNAIVPTSTDLGHHLYWAKAITESHRLPVYQEQAVIDQPENIHIADPEPIADFIIGEHLPFAAIAFLTGSSFFSAFPVIFLLFINILSLLALVIFAYRVVDLSPLRQLIRPQLVALSVLFLCGPLYTLASPQAKFVSGGVIGNIIGNLFIPLILLLFLRAFQEKDSRLLGLGFLCTFTLAYTHHLSTLILLFILAGSILLLIVSFIGHLRALTSRIVTILFQPTPIILILLSSIFFFFVAMPTYIEIHAVSTAIGTPTKLTRIGLTLNQITETSGDVRFTLSIVGLILIFAVFRCSLPVTLTLAWILALFLMTFRPDWLFLDIPSKRVGTYLSFPVGIVGAIGLAWLIGIFRSNRTSLLSLLLLAVIFVYSLSSGFTDNGQTLLATPKSEAALETFAAAQFLAEKITRDDVVLKDHNYIVADSWMKHFFMRDYFFPLSRGYFSRYENNGHEQCTLDMIAIPNTPRAQDCFQGTGVNYVLVNPQFDAPQFEKSPDFSRVYSSNKIHIYAR
ncbi:MAG: hypothetical protein KBC83_02265 [Candidatus Moranbacteria bacterium]|jgi:hypothetical protein|nr:hypothetical protein [Candidatus Moranbacteria bacterium]MBP9801471.1 hypothetical protein [Candidatus Moranbacteria bacterium]